MHGGECYIEQQPQSPDDDDPRQNFIRIQEASCPHHHGSNPRGRGNDFRDNQIGPSHRQHLPHSGDNIGQNGRKHDPENRYSLAGPKG